MIFGDIAKILEIFARSVIANEYFVDNLLKEKAKEKDSELPKLEKKEVVEGSRFFVVQKRSGVDLIISQDEPEIVKIQKKALYSEQKLKR